LSPKVLKQRIESGKRLQRLKAKKEEKQNQELLQRK